MGREDQDPTLQEIAPKGQTASPAPVELTTSDFVSVQPTRPTESGRGGASALVAWLLVLLLVVAAGVFAWKIWVPQLENLTDLRREVEVQKMQNVRLEEATRNQSASLDASLAELERLRKQLESLQADLEKLRSTQPAH